DGRVWLVDPVDVPEALDRARALGEPAGVIQLLDRHDRDGAALATRLNVPHLKLPTAVPGAPFEVVGVLGLPLWKEKALWWPAERALVVAEIVGTAPFFTAGTGEAGMHALVRALPPGALRGYRPEHLLVGHGPPVHGPQAADALEHAYARSRRDVPRLLAQLPRIAKAAKG
ncbi:MAG TPA: hypothetical protein VF533_08925, partial [Solirubrobacteraceae bacterium]